MRPATTTMQIGLECSFLMTLSGMAKTVGHPIPVSVPSTILHGSASSCLDQATTDDIEVRICGNQDLSDEDTPVELIELYVR